MRVGVYVGAQSPAAGGGYTFAHDIVSALEQRASSCGHDFTLLSHAPFGSGSLANMLLQEPPADLVTRARRRARRTLANAAARLGGAQHAPFANIVRRGKFDVLWHLLPGVCLDPDTPYITVVWDLQHRLQPFFPEVSAAGEFARRDEANARVLARAALVVTGTETGRAEIARFYGVADARMRVLPHPTPADAAALGREAPGLRPTFIPPGPYIFYPAQLWPHKNHVTLVDALGLLRKQHGLDLQLVLTGSDKGNLAHVLARARAAGVEDAIKYLGLVSREHVLELYRHAVALTYVTSFGPENLPPLEAFALGCPVVASDVAGAREQLDDAVQSVDPRSASEIAAAVLRIHGDETLRARLIARGRERARKFTAVDFVDGICAWLDEFAAVRRCWPAPEGP